MERIRDFHDYALYKFTFTFTSYRITVVKYMYRARQKSTPLMDFANYKNFRELLFYIKKIYTLVNRSLIRRKSGKFIALSTELIKLCCFRHDNPAVAALTLSKTVSTNSI